MILALALLAVASTPTKDPLAVGFQNPPASARPHTWWHWMDGNVTKEGITADLEAMKEVGIGGAQMFTVSQGIPKGPAGYMGPLWREMTVHAVKEAARLGIELCIHNCAGWSSSGGPWVKPENAMQVIAWSEEHAKGPVKFDAVLPQPKAPQVYASVPYYKDIATFAYPTQPGSPAREPDFLGRTGVVRQDGLLPSLGGPGGIPKAGVIDITRFVDANGKLTWDVPEGDWTILRMGHVPTGKDNHPAPREGDGLEVDKLSREAMDAYWNDGTMAAVLSDIGPLAGKSLNNALIDSYEVGSQNWTPKFREEFEKRRGYDPLPYLPVVAGVTIDSKDVSERFLWDFRRTIADLYADNYFGYFGELCHKAGLQFSTEPYGNGGFDAIQAGGTADIPMGEFWIGGAAMETTKVAASVGHVYGRPVIGAESFTADDVRGRWLEEPYGVKALGDLVFTNGVNRYIFHRYAQQPWMNLYPGMTMGPWGTHLERTQTWWTEARAWMKYIARCQYLLQQGTFVADTLYYAGENAPTDWVYGPAHNPRPPVGYDYDSADTVALKRLSVKDGMLVLPSGMRYRVLSLPENGFMTLPVLQKIRDLIAAGATVVGPKPLWSPTLTGFPESDVAVRKLAGEIWGTTNRDAVTDRRYGKGRIIDGLPLGDVYNKLGVVPDYAVAAPTRGAKTVYIHRRIGDAEVYFVSNQQYKPVQIQALFRVSGKAPELWHADSGIVEDAPVYRFDGTRTTVPLNLGPAESVFVVFRRAADKSRLTAFGRADLKPAPKAPAIMIQLARYETADGKGTDVTKIVEQMVKDGEVEIPATNGLFGDPAYNTVKRLRIEYTVDGKPQSKTVAENEMLALINLPQAPAESAGYELARVEGKAVLTPWKAGTFVGTLNGGKELKLSVRAAPLAVAVPGPWKVAFKPGWGAPESATFDKLVSWPDHKDQGIKYFSGSAVYSRTVTVPAGMVAKGRKVVLDLGRVKNFATVTFNGKELPVLWKEPFAVDVTGIAKAGANRLEVKVTNLWVNRIIGDEQLPDDAEWNGVTLKGWPEWLVKGEPRPQTGRYTFTTWKFWKKDSPLLESGLLGPVVLKSAKPIVLNP